MQQIKTMNSLTEAKKKKSCDVVWLSNKNAATLIVDNLSDFSAELQADPAKKGGAPVIRLVLPDPKKMPTKKDLQNAVQQATDCPDARVGEPARNSLVSGRYASALVELPPPAAGEKHPESFYLVLVTAAKKGGAGSEGAGGTAGPGEDELVAAIRDAGASVDNPINVIIDGKRFSGVTGAVKPSRSEAVGGEPKIDVLLLGPGGKGHRSGAFSLKLAADLGGAPTYGGWSLFERFVPGSKAELKRFLKSYVSKMSPTEVEPGVYENVGNFAARTSDEVADFAIYGNADTSGGKRYGKSRVDHVVEVTSAPQAALDEKGDLVVTGLKVHKKNDLFRGTVWEPFWLIRGASDRASGLPDLMLTKTRIAVAPAQRAAQYAPSAKKKTKSESLDLLKQLIKEHIRTGEQ